MLYRSRSLFAMLLISALLGGMAIWLQAPAPEPIRIGVLHALSGTMATDGRPLVDAARLAVEEINAGGGLLGRPVEMIVVDGGSDAQYSAMQAERLIRQERVSALFACWTSACRKAVKPIVERYRHLMFYPLQYEGMEQSPNIIYAGAAPNQQIIPGTRWAMDTFGRRVYLVGSDYIFPRAANLLIRDVASANDGSVVGERYLALGSDAVAAIVDDIRRQAPDVILNTINGDSNPHFFRALKRAGVAIPVLSFSLAESEAPAAGDDAFHPAHYAVWGYFQTLPATANRHFVTAFKGRFGAGRVTSDPVEASYNSVRLWANAVREIGTDDVEQVNRAIGRQSVPGPSGVVAVDAATRHVWRWVRIARARADGQFDIVQSSEMPVRPTPWPNYRSREEWQRRLGALAGEPVPGGGAR